jgi:hypothetical protein
MAFRDQRTARKLAALGVALIVTMSCAVGQERGVFSAESSDRRIIFYLSEQTARAAFESYCSEQPARTCDDFDRYRMEVNFDEDVFGLTFIHESPEDAPSADGVSILCAYALRERRECHSGRHRYN